MVGIMAVAALIGVLAITSNRDLGQRRIKTVGMQDNKMQYMITPTTYNTIHKVNVYHVILNYTGTDSTKDMINNGITISQPVRAQMSTSKTHQAPMSTQIRIVVR